ncbi:hypothetical protein SBA3_2640010 [Candidatus Sulfopaludibacter sp. SbA3]|nr:hypothetical protein SBA3_2640010 [Candidatus Sulfopaludibacter sp. SbA3]
MPAFPCGVKIHSRKIGQDINASRIASEAKEAAALGKLLRTDVLQRRTKLGKRRIHRSRVGRIRFYEHLDVIREAGLRVEDDSVTADDQVSNTMGMEGGQKVFVVLVHPAPSPNLLVRGRSGSFPQPRLSAHAPAGSASNDTRRPSLTGDKIAGVTKNTSPRQSSRLLYLRMIGSMSFRLRHLLLSKVTAWRRVPERPGKIVLCIKPSFE